MQVGSNEFSFVKKRAYGSVSIYKGKGSYLKIGSAEHIGNELRLHNRLVSLGFPVSRVIAEGELHGQRYYIESSLGEEHLGTLFTRDYKAQKEISEPHFRTFIELSEHFCRAQLSTAHPGSVGTEFYNAINMNYVAEERPDIEADLKLAFERMKKRLSLFPLVLTHNDLNPFNFLPNGIIDFEHAFEGPAGYDVSYNIYTIYLFPKPGDYEHHRGYVIHVNCVVELCAYASRMCC